MATYSVFIAALLVAPASCALLSRGRHANASHENAMTLGVGSFASIPLQLYRRDCGRHVAAALVQAGSARAPGAGMDPAAISGTQVLKDGFYEVGCFKDYMHEHGDKFGDNKFSYELGDVSGVSIVHYSAHIPNEDQESITPDVCFKFCRTVPDMLFFGLTHGRDCYCAPYYKPMASDSSACDEVCPGDNTRVCGGMSKSTIYEMHACSDTKTQVTDAAAKMNTLETALTTSSANALAASESMQTIADALQPGFSKVGDSAASGLLQNAKSFAGKLAESAGAGEKAAATMTALAADATTIESGGDIVENEALIAAEKLTSQIEGAVASGEAIVEELDDSLTAAKFDGDSTNASALYYPVMYFVDKEFVDVPSTCGGTPAGEPILATYDGCAASCTSAGSANCVGFSYLSNAPSEGLCFLLSKLTSVTYYTDCGEHVFSQKCAAKFARFEGTTLKPDPSGKCDQCLKAASRADRCFE